MEDPNTACDGLIGVNGSRVVDFLANLRADDLSKAFGQCLVRVKAKILNLNKAHQVCSPKQTSRLNEYIPSKRIPCKSDRPSLAMARGISPAVPRPA
jgi:hypothetical protein